MNNKLIYQEKFINIIKHSIPNNISLANEISSVLDISLDSAYRRLRCETDLTLNEVVILSHHFDVPLEALNDEIPNVVTFKFSKELENENNFKDYLSNIALDLGYLSKFESNNLVFAAEDIPVFHHFYYKKLANFKLFYWMKSIIGLKDLQTQSFEFDNINPELSDISDKIADTYSLINSTEIWTDETISSTLKQIKFYWDAGFFNQTETAMSIIDELQQLIQQLQKQAEFGKKINRKGNMTAQDYTMYHSDLMIGNNCVVVEANEKQSTYISYNSFNSMRTSNKFFNDQSKVWINNLKSKSTLISGVAEKQRNQFFKSNLKKIEDLKTYILNN